MTEHTPGPWKLSMPVIIPIVSDANGMAICQVYGHHPEAEADGRLIAAAPDLLRACEMAVETFDDDAPGPGLTEKEALHKLRAAVAKAKGEQP